jgi:RNA polymerase sigma factor (sigma-70 family)
MSGGFAARQELNMSAALEIDVRAAQEGDSLAFTRLVDASKNMVASIAFAILRDPATSEEVAQDVYLEVWKGLGSLRNPTSFLPWLRQVTRNRSHECLRASVRYRRRHGDWTADAEVVSDAMANASEQYLEAETRSALADAIEDLPTDAREVITLFYREGESVRQVAELLGLSETAVKKRLERCRDALRGAMLERFAEASKKTAPAAAFGAGVAAAIAASTPGTASAALAPSVKLAGTWKVGALFAPIAGVAVGAGAAFFGIAFEVKKYLDGAVDVHERRELEAVRRTGGIAVAVTTLWMLAGAAVLPLSKSTTIGMYVAGLLAFQAMLYVLLHRRLPQILSHRPLGDVDRRKRLLGFLVGSACGWGCMAFAIWRLVR